MTKTPEAAMVSSKNGDGRSFGGWRRHDSDSSTAQRRRNLAQRRWNLAQRLSHSLILSLFLLVFSGYDGDDTSFGWHRHDLSSLSSLRVGV
ncbi:hypothetical protein PIB30_064272, partial [Stylosanthes scabra]|nr:hypothetical protein [Stylosanthes scabra]